MDTIRGRMVGLVLQLRELIGDTIRELTLELMVDVILLTSPFILKMVMY